MANNNDSKPAGAPSEKAPSKPFLFIYNNAHGHRILTLRGKTASVAGTHTPGPTIPLPVGVSIVEARLWEMWKVQNGDAEVDGATQIGQVTLLLKGTIPRTQQRLENEGSTWLEEGPGVTTRAAPLADMEEAQARGVIARVLDAPMLRSWLTVEKRPAIAAALAERIEEHRKADAVKRGAA
jgi:hypothetical protein